MKHLNITLDEAAAVATAAATAMLLVGEAMPPDLQLDVARGLQKLHEAYCDDEECDAHRAGRHLVDRAELAAMPLTTRN